MSHDTSGDSADLASSPLDGRYRILSRLGSGGMADVYLARDESLGRLVAIKVLKERLAADAEFVERFRIEAQAAASLNHPAIVAVYDRGRAGASPVHRHGVRGRREPQAAPAAQGPAVAGRGRGDGARRAGRAPAKRTRATSSTAT